MIWIVTHISEEDWIATSVILSENKVEAYFRSELDIYDEDGSFAHRLESAMLNFESNTSEGSYHAFSVTVGEQEHYFQKLSGALFPTFLNDVDYLTIKSIAR